MGNPRAFPPLGACPCGSASSLVLQGRLGRRKRGLLRRIFPHGWLGDKGGTTCPFLTSLSPPPTFVLFLSTKAHPTGLKCCSPIGGWGRAWIAGLEAPKVVEPLGATHCTSVHGWVHPKGQMCTKCIPSHHKYIQSDPIMPLTPNR